MRLNFIINEDYLLYHILSSTNEEHFSSSKNKKDIITFQNYTWRKSRTLYNLFIGRMQPGDFEKSEPFKEAKNLTKFVLILKKSKEYKKLLLQTENYLQFCKKQWEGNYKYSSEVIKELTGFNLNKQFTVFITHPSLRNGRYLGNNRIAWGHYEDWSNYATVYLWHEILHSYLTFSDKDHAIIQLIADNELRIKLNKEKCLPLKGHKELFLLMKKMHPKWKKYTIARRKNFKELCKSLPSKP